VKQESGRLVYMKTRRASPESQQHKVIERETFVHLLDQVDAILSAEVAEQDLFIEKRIEELSQDIETGQIGYVGNRAFSGFIGPEMGIIRSPFVEPIYLDDPSIYRDLIDSLAHYKKNAEPERFNIGSVIPFAVQNALTNFFGNPVPTKNTSTRNREYLLDRSVVSQAQKLISISEYRGKRMGVCAEKSAVAQNFFQFLGIESVLIVGGVKKEGGSDSHHLFQIVRYKDSAFLYDSSNPKMKLNADGELTQYGPAMYSITEAQVQYLLNGGEVIVKSSSTRLDETGEAIEIDASRTYSGPTPK
jgi:hypothetical protein